MVSAKFHIVGEIGDWIRIRCQEEVYSHGLEGSVLIADERTIAVILDGDKAKVKRLYSDLSQIMPDGIQLSDLEFSLTKPTRGMRIHKPHIHESHLMSEYALQYLREIEKKTTRMDQKLNRIISILEEKGVKLTDDGCGEEKTGESVKEEASDMQVSDETTSVFAMMFGD